MKNNIGLDKAKSENLVNSLNDLLANFQVYYQNLRGFHWNITGPGFFELHAKFEELYTRANMQVDEIAERILTLEGEPLHTITDYIKLSKIKEARSISGSNETVSSVISNISILLEKEREILSEGSDAEDEGTVTLMSDYINEQEKVVWMLSAYLKNK